MAWRQVHILSLARIPTSDNQTPRVLVVLNFADQIRDLINAIAFRIVSTKRAPQVTIYWPKIARWASETFSVRVIRPLGPNIHAFRSQVQLVCVTRKKPE